MLAFLMDEHGLRQSELPKIGSQGVVSEILNGKREMSVRHIRARQEIWRISKRVYKLTTQLQNRYTKSILLLGGSIT